MNRALRGATDKPLGYLLRYEKAFSEIVDKEIALLELGVAQGGSLIMWRDYFQKGTIIGLDVKKVEIDDPTGRIRTYHGFQQDTELLTAVATTHAPCGFDVIVDDASHVGEITHASFWHLFERHLKPGGIYAIEDWGTGYWLGHPYYPDGRRIDPDVVRNPGGTGIPFLSHQFGMPGFVKQLVDEVGMYDITHPEYGVPPQRASKIARLEISAGLTLVFKV